jgi:hypothetical protein
MEYKLKTQELEIYIWLSILLGQPTKNKSETQPLKSVMGIGYDCT